ncbi:MAG: sigma-70 family RNA polymerase sigma factor [Acidobacteriota bacterium]|jgi:RNA polymerase sigma-70 factor (ECF subfamily)
MASVPRRELPVESDDELTLVERARAGDREAAGQLLERHELSVWRVCRHLLPPGEDVEGAVQETFVRALDKLHRYSGKGSFGGWLATIAANYCRDRRRRGRLVPFRSLEGEEEDDANPLAVFPADGPDPERTAMGRQAMARVQRELARLPRRQQEAFVLRFFAGMELADISAALGVDVGSVKTHLHRAVRRLREQVLEAVP